ncbi:MAG TPA: alpha/beta hydrolase [Sphingomonas sp.]|nr:alpha/beta hydrolase [Sphingomonas sp.]
MTNSVPDVAVSQGRETVFLVPGLLCDATVWGHQIAALGQCYDVRVPNLTEASSIDAMVDLFLADAPPHFSIAGHSMGARVALRLIARAPDRVDRLALFDTGVHPVAPDEAAKRQVLLDISATLGMRALADRWLPPMVRDGALDRDPDLRGALYAMVERMSPAIHRSQIAALLGRPDAAPGLTAIACPVLVGVGAKDRWSPPEQHAAIAQAIPHARYAVFPDSGHMAPMESPAEVTAALEAWMREPVFPKDAADA